MRSKMTLLRHATAFERVLEGLAQELIESSDDELLDAAKSLGMDPSMRGSAAFIGIKYPALPRATDFFERPSTRIEAPRSPALPRPTPPSRHGKKRR